MTSPSGLATYFNPAFCRWMGQDMTELIRFGWLVYVHPEDLAGALQAALAAFTERIELRLVARFATPTGSVWAWQRVCRNSTSAESLSATSVLPNPSRPRRLSVLRAFLSPPKVDEAFAVGLVLVVHLIGRRFGSDRTV